MRRRAKHEARQPPGTSTNAPLPPYAPDLFKFTQFAVGDEATAIKLMVKVLAQSPKHAGEAVQLLVSRLPKTWLSWPDASNSDAWGTLRLRQEQADRLLMILGEWTALERLALALYLLWDVPYDQLDRWLGTTGIASCISERIRYAGSIVGLVEPVGQHQECAVVHADLLEACEQRADPAVRLHLLSCDTCRRHVAALQRSTWLLRQALDALFRAMPPSNLAQQIAAYQHRPWLRFTNVQMTFALVIILLGLALSVALRPSTSVTLHPSTSQASPQVRLSATDLLDRALHQFDYAPQQGVLHERVRFGHGDDVFQLERWYDYAPPHRLRVIVRRPSVATPLLDLGTDGKSWLGYIFAPNYRPPDEAFIRDPGIEELLPLLRQLPFTGSFGGLGIEQSNIDLTLLAQARHGQLALHGISRWNGRPAYVVSSVQADRTRLILTIDQQTFSLLAAYSMSVQGGATSAVPFWQAEVVEVLPRAPASAFASPTNQAMQIQLDPRRLAYRRASNLDFHTAIDSTRLPVPTALPEPPILAYLRRLDWPVQSVLQMYDSEWSTLAIVVPTSQYHPFTTRSPMREFEHGRFATVETGIPAVTLVEFAFDGISDRHVALYYWHGLASDTEREAMVVNILNGMELVDQNNVAAYSQHFLMPATSEQPSGTNNLAPIATPARTLSIHLAPELRYLRMEVRQAQ